MVTWEEFEAWLALHGIEGKRCDKIEMILAHPAGKNDAAVWLKVHQYAVDEKGDMIVADHRVGQVVWEDVVVPLAAWPESKTPKGSRSNPLLGSELFA
jgi:hypothetical protein